MINSFRIETAGATLDSVDFVVLQKQQFGEIRAILAGDASDECAFAACRKCDGHLVSLLVCFVERAVRLRIRATSTNSTGCAGSFSHFRRSECEHAASSGGAFTFPQMKLIGQVPDA